MIGVGRPFKEDSAFPAMSALLPTRISDTFDKDSGKWLDGNLSPATITISGGRGIWTPTAGAQALINADFEGAFVAGLAANWTKVGVPVVAEENVIVHGGSKSQKISTGLANQGIYQGITGTVGSWYQTGGWVYVTAGEVVIVQISGVVEMPFLASVTGAAWSKGVATTRCLSAASANLGPYFKGNTAADIYYVDDAFLQPLTTITLVRWQPIYYVSEISVKLWHTPSVNTGLIIGKNINNFLLVHLTGLSNIKLTKCVGGIYTEVGTSPIVYNSGATAVLTPTATFNTFDVFYDEVEEISDINVNDFASDVDGSAKFKTPYYAGLFCTYNSGDINIDAFDDFIATKVAY